MRTLSLITLCFAVACGPTSHHGSKGGDAPALDDAFANTSGTCPDGLPRVDITTASELEDATRGEGSFADDAPSTCYFVHDGTYTSTANALLYVLVGGAAGSPRRFVGESRDGVRIVQRGTIEADHVVVENMTFDLAGYVHDGAFNTIGIVDATDVRITNVSFTGDCATGSRGGHVEIDGGRDVLVEGCLVERFGACAGDGHLDHGFYLASGSDLVLRGNVVRENSSRGIQLNTEGGDFGTLERVTIEGNRIHHNGHRDYEDGIVVNATGTGSIHDVAIRRNVIFANRYSGLRFVGDALAGVVVEDNTFADDGLAAGGGHPSEINLDDVGSGAATTIRDNVFAVGVTLLNDCYDAGPRGFALTHNLVSGTAAALGCVSDSLVQDPGFVDAAAGDFHTVAPLAYGAYAP